MESIYWFLFKFWMGNLLPLMVLIIVFVVGWVVRRILLLRVSAWIKASSAGLDGMVLSAVKTPSYFWLVMLSLLTAVKMSSLSQGVVAVISKIIFILFVVSLIIAGANVLTRLIRIHASKSENFMPVTSLTTMAVRVLIYAIGSLIILNSLGISITPILATLGIGGLAVALALQDTLSNLFAGFYIIAARQFNIGDYVKLESGEEGYIVDIGWRTTRMRMLANNIVLVPNAKMAQSILINFCLPEKPMSALVGVGVHYDSDLSRVETVTCEVAREVMQQVPGGVPDFEPFIRYHTFGDSSIQFNVILRVREFVDQYSVRHEFIKRLHERYRQENIIIPYPIRTLEWARGESEAMTARGITPA